MSNRKHVTGFHQQQTEEPEMEEKKQLEPGMADCVLDAYFLHQTDSGRWTSQDICDNLRETADLDVHTVTNYMMAHGYKPERVDDRLVWTKES